MGSLPTGRPAALPTYRRAALLLLASAACSSLSGDSSVPIAIELRIPAGPSGSSPLVEISDTIQIFARALNQAGDSIAATFRWRTPDTATLYVDSVSGKITGKKPGLGRVQARVGSLVSDLVSFAVVPYAESLLIVPPDSFRVLIGDTISDTLVAELDTLNPTGPLANRQIVYELLSPIFGQPGDTATLNGGFQIRIVTTGTNGRPTVPVFVLSDTLTRPDSVFVEINAFRPSTDTIPGSGQRFIVRFD